ncbi:hypothetical protein K502DRAFT_323818 [Neoconidiobolus thromboides FSU 785]|nr:hypothetical protein K502DRAFT_323818 [Neoconidiobolus thromboides FSU 785]
MGGGNDKPTPRIVLDILGSDPNNEPEALSFHSLGEGSKQHNMAKVYTGLYECYGHVVPYLVVVKVGKPTERAKPGNRGKRDSQLILMKFFNKVHYDHPMVPLELEMYHQIKNVIGVDPHFYEYVLMVDADTVVMPDSLNRLVSAMLHDTKIMGLCGETALANEKDTWATMIQVYEYYISHHLAKAFESLFGSVTCLPGCFCMYRLRTPAGQPLLVHNVLITDYSENRVDTLHKKNLLHLGEDRYLTTLMLKHFPFQKMTFTPDAMCLTNAPDTWDVLLSQRRRWINSTVHNLLELVFLPRLCGFCCFSMRFVVFMDLLSTIIMPATLGYLGYLLYRLITDSSNIPIISLIFILAPYVLQMTVFILRRQWQHIGWMIVYLLALPIFAFFIPIYSFWHFDDFSWGSTRIVVGENGKRKKVIVASGADEGKFDIKTIPTKKWTEYEEEIWEAGTEYSNESKKSNLQNKTQSGFYPPINNTNSMLYQPNQLQNPTQSIYQNMNSGPRSSNMIIGNMLPNNIASRPGSRLNINNPSTEFYNNNNNNNTIINKNTMSQYNNNIQNESYQMMPMPTNNNNNITNPYQRNVNNRSGSGMFDNTNQQGYLGHHYVPGTESPKPLLGYDTPNDTTSNSPIVATQLEVEIMDEVAIILENADLMAITKKQVRDQVANKLNRDMQPYKELINRCIEKVLQNQG